MSELKRRKEMPRTSLSRKPKTGTKGKGGKAARVTGIRQCGQRWASAEGALHSKRFLAGAKLVLEECPPGGCKGWHLRSPQQLRSTLKSGGKSPSDPSPETRAMVLDRDEFCVRCPALLEALAVWHCHHRRRRSQGGTNDLFNLIGLCPPCHAWVHAHVSESYKAGWLVRSGKDPETCDPSRVPVKRAFGDTWVYRWLTEDGEWVGRDPQAVAA